MTGEMDVELFDTLGRGIIRIAGQWWMSTSRRLNEWASSIQEITRDADPELLAALGLDRLATHARTEIQNLPKLAQPLFFDREAFIGISDQSVSSSEMLRSGLDAALEADGDLRDTSVVHVAGMTSRLATGLTRFENGANLLGLVDAFVAVEPEVDRLTLRAPIDLVLRGAPLHSELRTLVVDGTAWLPEPDRAKGLVRLASADLIEPSTAIEAAETLPPDLGELVTRQVAGSLEHRRRSPRVLRQPSALIEEAPRTSAVAFPPQQPRRHIVNTGIIVANAPDRAVSQRLQPSSSYVLWTSIGEKEQDALPGDDTPLDLSEVASASLLDVVFFPDSAFSFDRAQSSGVLRLTENRDLVVERAASSPPTEQEGPARKLYFVFRTPALEGVHAIRVAIYFRQMLLNVVQVTLPIGRGGKRIRSRTTYRLISSPTPDRLRGVRPHRLSIFQNQQLDGTHGLYFHGAIDNDVEFNSHATFSPGRLTEVTDLLRKTLREVSWGSELEVPLSRSYRYGYNEQSDSFGGPNGASRLEQDLIKLAKSGFEAWSALVNEFRVEIPGVEYKDSSEEFRKLMRLPGTVQLAPKTSPEQIFPVALLYDGRIDSGAKLDFCPNAREALLSARDGSGLRLTEHDCFRGRCESFYRSDIVCPGSFWGFRHGIAICPSENRDLLDTWIPTEARPMALLAFSTDRNIGSIRDHQEALKAHVDVLHEVRSRDDLEIYLPRFDGQVLYMLCHGRKEESRLGPALVIGPSDSEGIGGSTIEAWKVKMTGRPLVIMNCCGSADLSPERAVSLVEKFQNAGASAAIGTEIAVFPSLAKPFGLQLISDFAGPSRTRLATSVRNARLSLLGKGNPLGLAYVPFGPADTALTGAEVA